MRRIVLYILLALSVHVYASQARSEASACMFKALRLFEKDNFPEAMRLFTRSMELADSLGDEHTWLVSTGYISNIYFNAGDYGRALYYQGKGYEVAKRSNDKRLQKNYLSNMVAACCKSGRVELAKKYISQLQKLVDERGDNVSHYYLLYDQARISTAEGKYAEAMKKHLLTLDYAQKNKMDEEYILFQYCELGNLCLLEGNYRKAVEWGQMCLKPGVTETELDFMTGVYKLLADAYIMSGEKDKGDYYNKRYFVLQDSVFNRNRMFSAGNELFEYESRKTDRQIDSLNGTISRQFITIAVFGILVVALALVSVLLFRNNRRLNEAYRLLIRKDKEMDMQETRNKRLLEESITSGKAEPAPAASSAEKEDGSSGVGMSEEVKKRLLNSVIEVMKNVENISKPDFSLNALAEAVGSNTRYVSWVINDTYGKNFKTLLNEFRIKEACRRLQDNKNYGNMTLQAIYEDVGYTNNVSFIRAFKKVNGMTPSEYQRQCRIEDSAVGDGE